MRGTDGIPINPLGGHLLSAPPFDGLVNPEHHGTGRREGAQQRKGLGQDQHRSPSLRDLDTPTAYPTRQLDLNRSRSMDKVELMTRLL
jgi:hypothetical protein